jgi:hypothetical protein
MSVFDATNKLFYNTLSDAITYSSANDVIVLSPGSYTEAFPAITHSLTIQAVVGMAYLTNPWLNDLSSTSTNHRAVIDVPVNQNVNLTLIGLDISGAVDDAFNPPQIGGANGAGVLFESGNGALVIDNSHIHNNEDGVLVGATNTAVNPNETVTITNSEIDHNGASIGSADAAKLRAGFDHNIYIGAATKFTLTNSYVHDALDQGHEVKSRAQTSVITGNRIQDNSSVTSYAIDLPNGGNALVKDNTIEKGVNSVQNAVVDCGAEGAYTGSQLTFTGNTVINDGTHLGNPTLMYTWCATTVSANQLFGLTNLGVVQVPTGSLLPSGNQLLPLASAPALDTSSPVTPLPAPEPAAYSLMLISLLATVVMHQRRLRLRRSRRPLRCHTA